MTTNLTSDPGVDPGADRTSRGAFVAFDELAVLPRVQMFASGVRWAAVLMGLVINLTRDPSDPIGWACAVSLVAFALWQTVQPPDLSAAGRALEVAIGLELGLTVAVVGLTEGLESAYVLTPMVPLLLAGYTWFSRRILGLAYLGLAIIGLLGIARRADPEAARSGVLLGIVLLLCAVLGAFTRRLIDESTARHRSTLDQVTRMTTANEMLVALHGLAQTLPASLDLTEVTESMRLRLRELFDYGSLTVLVHDEFGGGWRVAIADGVRAPEPYAEDGLPRVLRVASDGGAPVRIGDHLVAATVGIDPMARSGLYAALRARGKVVGVVAIEHRDGDRYDDDDRELLDSVTGAIALSFDNALWFSRLRRLGAESERARIARDLHDRIAQSLAYVAFELERLAATERPPSTDELGDLRDVVRGVVTELRDTLYELRAAVSDHEDLVVVAERYLERFGRRTGIDAHFEHHVEVRPPVAMEQELWRIAQEALENAARHAQAEHVTLRYHARNGRIGLSIEDDGRGFDPRASVTDHYGLVGMRERADAIGAALRIDSRPGRGARIELDLEVHA